MHVLPVMPSSPPFDLATLRDLFGDDATTIQEILVAFADDLTLGVTNIQAAAATRDRVRLARIVHGMKGASANVGAASFAALCGSLERLAPTAPWSELTPLCEELCARALSLRAAVRAHDTGRS